MLIARRGNFGLETAAFLGEHTYNTHELNIVKYYIEHYEGEEEEFCFVIASFNEKGEVVSCGSRLFDEICLQEDFDTIRALAKIGEIIISRTDKVETGRR